MFGAVACAEELDRLSACFQTEQGEAVLRVAESFQDVLERNQVYPVVVHQQDVEGRGGEALGEGGFWKVHFLEFELFSFWGRFRVGLDYVFLRWDIDLKILTKLFSC
jgi:hypothetical protein